MEVERYSPGYRPPVSARSMGLINLMAYEAIVHGSEGRYQSFSGYFDGLEIDEPDFTEVYDWEVVVNAAYEKGFEYLFPTAPAAQQFQILDIGGDLRAQLQLSGEPEVFYRSVEYGNYVAETIYEWSATDTWGHEGYLNNNDPEFVPPVAPHLWKPTYPDYAPALLPHWGKAMTFAALPTDVVEAPPVFSVVSGSQLYQEAEQVMTLVNSIKAGGSHEEHWIGEFWSDDCPILTFTPAGRQLSITNQLVAIERLDMLETVAAYAKVSMAISDAGVRCWSEKYRHNYLRPIDYIREHMGEPDWNTVMCPDGSGGFFTPSFPAYPSGHATFGGAAAVVLEEIFGADYTFTDRSHEGRTEFNGTPRTFTSFRAMAIENGYSRIPLGVHFASDSDAGVELGFTVGQRVNDLPWN
ncbi:vanadium-dependent haloperoxidase [Neolewinella aurantiaca]|uniref:Vanadium-dependent haloperoxidase n=1 Tax=Neolewinella aurantiaca TaxID=2602767 RepID=A0A5C7FYK9_9BACT|nr:vanadium-dependent haloperoxidase [Neolewinella aurantiaca]TXF90749.1 vanadium-dependent haloperoxidase [Neolewinella aurantiaca]